MVPGVSKLSLSCVSIQRHPDMTCQQHGSFSLYMCNYWTTWQLLGWEPWQHEWHEILFGIIPWLHSFLEYLYELSSIQVCYVSDDTEEFSIEVTEAMGKKCLRCWKFTAECGEDICDRCHTVVSSTWWRGGS